MNSPLHDVLLVALVVALLLLAGWLVWWLVRWRRRAVLPKPGFVPTRTPFVDTAPGGPARRTSKQPQPDDEGWSYRDAPAPVPQGAAPGAARASGPVPLFPEDFADTTRPQARHAPAAQPAPRPTPTPTPVAPGPGHERIQRALATLGDGPVDQAWEALRGFVPEPGQRAAAMATLARLAVAFEASARHAVARDVYEHMADIDPRWPHVKARLARARALAQSATVHTWGTVPPRPMPHIAGGRLGPYVLERELGKGAMGVVWLAHDPLSGRSVALKTMAMAQEFSGAELAEARARFLREAEMSGRLQHPDIVGIADAGERDGVAYIAMEHVTGVDLAHHAQPGTLLPLAQLLPVLARVADALAYAHTRGVTHRDIKPANIMVDLARDSVKVMDFGVARVADASRTRTGVVLGTPSYMSPEQLSGQAIDGRSDLYSLGVSMFQLLTGQLPYRTDSMAALMRAIGRETPPHLCDLRPDLPVALGDIVALALEKHPQTRYASGAQMAQDLRSVLAGLSATPPVAAPPQASPQIGGR